jgi:hypothetical protein
VYFPPIEYSYVRSVWTCSPKYGQSGNSGADKMDIMDFLVEADGSDELRDYAEERANLLVMHEECEGCVTCRKGEYSYGTDEADKAYEAFIRDNPDASYLSGSSYQTWANQPTPDFCGNEDTTDEDGEPCCTGTDCPSCAYLDMLFNNARIATNQPESDCSDMSGDSDSSDFWDTEDYSYGSDFYGECDSSDMSGDSDIQNEEDDWDTPAVRGMWS